MSRTKEQEQRISRLCRMAGNIAAGLASGDYEPCNALWVAQESVQIAVAIDAEVHRVCETKEEPPHD